MVFNYTKDKNNIVTLTMDMAEKSANLIDEDFFKSLLENIVKLENESDLKSSSPPAQIKLNIPSPQEISNIL